VTDRTPPQSLEAERAVIAASLLSGRTLSTCMEILRPDDFYRPAHAAIWQLCVRLHNDSQPVDAITVRAALQSAGDVHGLATLLELTSAPPETGIEFHARIVADRSRLRAVIEYGTHLIESAYRPGDTPAETLIAEAADKVRTLRDSGAFGDDDITAITLDELLALHAEYDWVMPGLLERGDRLLLTGSEGLGKSFLSRQMAICAAAGLHPFTFEPVDPIKVLVLDAENSLKINLRAYGWMKSAAASFGVNVGNRFLIDSYPYGTNVIDPRMGNKLIRTVEMQQPDLIVIGPLYKIHELDDEKAGEALRIQHYLDRVRAVCGSALILELHSPHGSGTHGRDMRPAGSSVWRRWPEFGYGMTLATGDFDEEYAMQKRLVDLKPWRGPRDERAWPVRLRGGTSFPWIPAHVDEDVQPANTWGKSA
jgi:hypothetical protein